MKKFLTYGLAISALFYSCKEDRINIAEERSNQQAEERSMFDTESLHGSYVRGAVYLHVTESSFERFSISGAGEVAMNSVPSQMSKTLTNIRASRVERLFPDAGKYEARSRQRGLHRWFKVIFDESIPAGEVCSMMVALPEVEYAEPIPTLQMPTGTVVPISEQELRSLRAEYDMPFNDPLLREQWHYHNVGTAPKAEVGADINLFPAWKGQTGKRNVIVAIVDGGIDTEHEDLVDNLYVNEVEKNGKPDVDDDKNGYVDDIYGFNFVTNKGLIEPDYASHGTHVAGTVAARNNNGIGVCGVAGGDGSEDSGVRLLSCQIFRKERESADTPAALKYGADNGAVISQNSWGYNYPGPGSLPRALQDAIDYFIDFAGCDENGNQLPDSPMKGGVVIFAAGNDGANYKAYPAAYERIISVAAMSTNFTKASYSNMGIWVTIMAPGGDQSRYGNLAGVLSTLSPKISMTQGKKYGYYQGTSMACPHVSGVAALVVSKYGKQGFTNKNLEGLIKSSVLDVDIDRKNPGIEGTLGHGYIDANSALNSVNRNKSPETPKVDIEKSQSEAGITRLSFYWSIPTDEDDGKPSRFLLYYSPKELNAGNYKYKGATVRVNSAEYISAVGRKVGEEMSVNIDNLKDDKTYYFALVAVDRWGLASEPAIVTLKTRPNLTPVVTGVPTEPIRVSNISDKYTFTLTVSDPDGHSWKMPPVDLPKGVRVKKERDKIHVTVRATLEPGKYDFSLVFVDELQGKTTVTIPFEVYEIVSPKIALPITNQLMGLDQPKAEYDLTKVFSYSNEVPVKFTASSSDDAVVSTSVKDGKLILSAHKNGLANVKVVADNEFTDPTMLSFEVRVIKDKSIPMYSVYPIPTRDNLNVWLNPEVKTATLVITTMAGEEVFNKAVTADKQNIGTVNISKFVPGAYKLTVKTSKGDITRTIVKN
ncbi:S8 family serine peptidase [Porphyromonas sp.]|uniref:S8 family serine peptidase n=1 Tax=Porphyromonas sp. TaxID=1924944 RepID=UPI0026DD2CD0|nr:S8 family serine peptidase [Porphyromonas sp.]MDO4771563.1 S8 family serine peptidase [Porphyromonas sp.]